MRVYLDLAVLLNMCVDFLLLMGTARLLGNNGQTIRTLVAAALGGIYAGACLLPGWSFLGNPFWRILAFVAMVITAFGWNRGSLGKGIVFMILNLTLGGAAVMLQSGSFAGVLLVAVFVVLIFTTGLSWLFQGKRYFTLELLRGDKKTCLTALYDTGNELKDPISGESVVVVGPSVAEYFFGLTRSQLSTPLNTVESNLCPVFRLIPYQSVDRSHGFLLAASFDEVRINGKASSRIVAFAPDAIGRKYVYDALIGGNLSCI